MNIDVFKTSVIAPCFYDIKKFDDIEENDYMKNKPISISCGRDLNWVSFVSESLFDEKKAYYKRLKIDKKIISKLSIDNNSNNSMFYLKVDGKERYKLYFDDIYVWVMKSGNAFVSFNITLMDSSESKFNNYRLDSRDIASIVNKLKDKDRKIYYKNVIDNDKENFREKSINICDMANSIFKMISIKDNNEDILKYTEPLLMMNYVITDDITSDEATNIYEMIDSEINPDSLFSDKFNSIDEKRFYIKPELLCKWLSSKQTVTMIGSNKNTRLIDGNGAADYFDSHMFMFLHYYDIYMTCFLVKNKKYFKKVNMDIKKLLLKERWKILKRMLEFLDDDYKIESANMIRNEYTKGYEDFLKDGKNKYLGGIVKTDLRQKEHLKMIYSYHYALQELKLVKELSKCFIASEKRAVFLRKLTNFGIGVISKKTEDVLTAPNVLANMSSPSITKAELKPKKNGLFKNSRKAKIKKEPFDVKKMGK